MNPGNIVWIFGAGRTGSTWLASMMGEMERHTVWFEPWVGNSSIPTACRLVVAKANTLSSPQYKKTWLRSIRNFVLDGADARFPEVTWGEYLITKEPGGSTGAVLLMEALPESRMILLVRDPATS